MGSKSDAFEIDILKAVTAQTTSILQTTALSGVYVGLFTVNPTDSTAGTEVSGGSYARVNSKTKWGTPSAGSVSTNADLVWPTASADWGTITGFAIFDAATTGNMMYWGALNASKVVSSGDTFSILATNLTITED